MNNDIDSIIWFRRMLQGKHLCHKCILCDELHGTTEHYHTCKYAYGDSGDLYVEDESWMTEDYGSHEYYVVKCKNFIEDEDITKRIYPTWISSDSWKRIAREKIKQSGYQCEICGSAMNLCVHHITYEHLCFEDKHMEDLLCVCKDCHKKIHENDLNKRAQENAVVKGVECKRQSM